MTGRLAPAIAAALPGLVLAGIGLTHPHDLAPATAGHWITLHVWLVPIFPLLGLTLLIPGWRSPRWARILLAALIFLYVVYYGALDAVAGIGAGIAVQRNQARGDVDRWLLDVGNSLGWVGSIAFLAAALLVAGVVFQRVRGPALIPGLILVGSAISYLDSHIYAPRGVITVLLIGLATGWLTWVAGRRTPPATTSAG